MDARTEILNRVRAARVPAAAIPPVPAPESPPAGDLAERFALELRALTATCHRVPDAAALASTVADILRTRAARRLIAWDTPAVAALRAAPPLAALSLDWTLPKGDREADVASWREQSVAADAGLTEVDYALADTGTLVVRAGAAQPSLASLAPSLHIAIVPRQRLLPNLDALLEALGTPPALSSCLTLITGPSRTADIEKKIVLGVHGPEYLEVILLG